MIEFALDQRYDKSQFMAFLKTFLPDDYSQQDSSVDINFRSNFITEAVSLGSCKSIDLEVYEIHHTSLNDARVGLSKDAFRLLLDQSYNNRALVVFIPEDGAQWRLSLLQMEAEINDHTSRITRSYSNPRRYSFLLGEGAHTKTPHQFLFEKGQIRERKENNKTLSLWEDLESRFSVESLAKEFYDRLYHWYQWAVETQTKDAPGVTFPNNPETTDDDKDNMNVKIIRLITRLLFVWFIKQKELVPNDIFDTQRLKELLRDFNPYSSTDGTYYNAILQNLFFATLNNEIDKRAFSKPSYMGKSSSYGVKSLFRDSKNKSWFNVSHEEILSLFSTVPYMNCGLFECLDKVAKSDINTPTDKLLDGFSSKDTKLKDPITGKENYKYRAFIPNELFFTDEKEVLVTVEEKKGKIVTTSQKPVKVVGLLRLFEEYNFTVEENTPSDVQVSLDPELLGRVFENLLAAYNPETKENARKSTGSFYTPRPIVEYMVNESLVQYLKTKVVGGEQLEPELRKLVNYKDEEINIPEVQRRDILHCLYTCKVLDPACGSGAFPMGMLQQMVHIMRRIDPDNTIWHDVVLEEATREMMNALNNEKDKDSRHQRMQEIEQEFDDDLTNPDYKRKLYLIRNCIYGVDIQPIAMLISKLRFFISLVCEQNPDKNAPEKNYGINTLPNLETKFVAANTLIPASIRNYKEGLFSDTELTKLKDELLDIRMRHFQVKTQRSKLANREKDGAKRDEIKDYILNTAAKIDEELIAENKQRIADLEEELKLYQGEDLVEEAVPVQANLFDFNPQVVVQTVDRNKRKRADIKSRINICKNVILREENKRNLPEFEAAVREVTQWNPYDQVNASPFFDPEWMFGIEGGFDIIIANPPYGADLTEKEKDFYKDIYSDVHMRTPDTYNYFISKAFKLAINNNSLICYIVPNNLFFQIENEKSRKLIMCENRLIRAINLGDAMFENVDVPTCVFVSCIGKNDNYNIMYSDYRDSKINSINWSLQIEYIPISLLSNVPNYILGLTVEDIRILDKIKKYGKTIDSIAEEMACGISTGDNNAYTVNDNEVKTERIESMLVHKYLSGYEIDKYVIQDENNNLIYMTRDLKENVCPNAIQHLLPYKESLSKRSECKKGLLPWWAMNRPRNPKLFSEPKIIMRQTSDRLRCVFDDKGYFVIDSILIFKKNTNDFDYKFIVGVLNSTLANYLYQSFTQETGRAFAQVKPANVRKVSIPNISSEQQVLICNIVNTIEIIKHDNPNEDVSEYEKEIDKLIYKYFHFEYKDVLLVDPKTDITQSEYESFNPDEL